MRQSKVCVRSLAIAAAALIGAYAMPARAGTFPAAEIGYDMAALSQFNLITLGNYTNSSGAVQYTAGRAIVGGSLTATGSSGSAFCNTCTGNATAAIDPSNKMFGALTVFGNVTGTFAGGYANGGTTYVGGNASGYFYGGGKAGLNVVGNGSGLQVDNPVAIRTAASAFQGTISNNTNNVAAQTGITAATVFPFGSAALSSEMKNLAKGIANLPGSPGVTTQTLPPNNGIFFAANNDYVAAGKKYGVVTTTLANLAGQQNFKGIDNGTNDATFVIVTGDGANYLLPNLNSYAGANKVIFDFVDATTLRFAGNWNGSILAPLANITQMGGAIDGSVVVNSINQTQALYANNLFTGSLLGLVPEPGTLALLGLGAAAAGMMRRRRAAAA